MRKQNETRRFAVARKVYYRNLKELLNNLPNQLVDMMNTSYHYTEVNDGFLWGIFDHYLADRPPLPTDAHMRLMLYMCFFISQEEQIPFVTARERVLAVDAKFNNADRLLDSFISAGRRACADTDDQYLIACHKAATYAASIVAP
jgi:hypothetical protein